MNNNIRESYCSFEVSKLLKEKGYRNDTVHYYIDINNNHSSHKSMSSKHFLGANWNSYPSEENSSRVSCPTHALAVEWIRVNFGIWITLTFGSRSGDNTFGHFGCQIHSAVTGLLYEINWHKNTPSDNLTPQEATEAALLYTLNNLI